MLLPHAVSIFAKRSILLLNIGEMCGYIFTPLTSKQVVNIRLYNFMVTSFIFVIEIMTYNAMPSENCWLKVTNFSSWLVLLYNMIFFIDLYIRILKPCIKSKVGDILVTSFSIWFCSSFVICFVFFISSVFSICTIIF